MDTDQTVEVKLHSADDEFEFAEVNDTSSRVENHQIETESKRTKRIHIKSQDAESVSFIIRPLKVGFITIKVVATSAIAGDGVERLLIVKPEGVTEYSNAAVLVDLRKDSEFKTNINITIPPNAVPDSTRIKVSAIGDILGPSIDSLDKLM